MGRFRMFNVMLLLKLNFNQLVACNWSFVFTLYFTQVIIYLIKQTFLISIA